MLRAVAARRRCALGNTLRLPGHQWIADPGEETPHEMDRKFRRLMLEGALLVPR